MTEAPKPPARPHQDECCKRGCDPCIFDYYWQALERWENRMRELGLDPALNSAPPRAGGDPS